MPHDFALLEWHATGQLAVIDASSGAVKKVGAPAMIRSISPSPDGAYVRVTTMRKPFSYIVPVGNFGQIEEIWDASGRVLAKVSERPINLGVRGGDDDDDQPGGGRGGGAAGKREVTWRPDGQGLSYLEQEPAPANGGRTGGAAATPADDDAAPTRRLPMMTRRAARSPVSVGRALRCRRCEGDLPAEHAHGGRALFARHEVALLPGAPGHGRERDHERHRGQPGQHASTRRRRPTTAASRPSTRTARPASGCGRWSTSSASATPSSSPMRRSSVRRAR